MLTIQKKNTPNTDKELDLSKIPAERRMKERILSHAPVVISRFGTSLHREYLSMAFNRSESGMCLETSEPFEPGAVLNIRPGQAPIDRICRNNQTNLLPPAQIEVKWCREYLDESNTHYRIGVKNSD